MKLVNTIEFKTLGDDRGSLVSLEQNKNIPFEVKRIYYIFGTKEGVSRGFHAHKNLQQVAICVKVAVALSLMMDITKTKLFSIIQILACILVTLCGEKCMIFQRIAF